MLVKCSISELHPWSVKTLGKDRLPKEEKALFKFSYDKTAALTSCVGHMDSVEVSSA